MSARLATSVIVLARRALHRAAWQALLADRAGLRLHGAADTAEGTVALPPVTGPGALLVDLPALAPEDVAGLAARHPGLGIVALVDSYAVDEILPLLRAGAGGCVGRDDGVGDLVRALVAAGRGELALPPPVAARALATLARGATGARVAPPAPSAREATVLGLVGRGYTNKDIAQALLLSVRTVEAHLRTIFGKLGVRSRTEAALRAVRHGYGEGGLSDSAEPRSGDPAEAGARRGRYDPIETNAPPRGGDTKGSYRCRP